MNNNQKIGLGFLLVGLLIIPLFYFIASDEGFAIAAMMGLMAIVFGGFQLIFGKTVSTRTGKATRPRKTSRR